MCRQRPRPYPHVLAILALAAGADPACAQFPLVGTASCSNRGCHGRLEPLPGKVGLDEYTTWVRNDKHADAYEVLFREPAKRMAERLNCAPAHEAPQCLACHTTPTPRAELQPAGVGCESCHGGAQKWLTAHSAPGWSRLAIKEKHGKFGMAPLADLLTLGRACVGCHVGAPADPKQGIPARDVNHELIAAGHPPLRFELVSYFNALPAHWNTKAAEQRRGPGFSARLWTVGQLVSAQAAVDLLADRAEPSRSWPEFAEHDCFACHHDLRPPGKGRRLRPGALPWGTWHLSLVPLLDLQVSENPGPDPLGLDRLDELMSGPNPAPKKVAALAASVSKNLERWRDRAAGQPYSEPATRNLLHRLVRQEPGLPRDCWANATQRLFGAAALHRNYIDELTRAGRPLSPADRETPELLRRLGNHLAFPERRATNTFQRDLIEIFPP